MRLDAIDAIDTEVSFPVSQHRDITLFLHRSSLLLVFSVPRVARTLWHRDS